MIIMKKYFTRIFTCSFLTFAALSANAQTDADAFRFSGTGISGTSRFTAMSGAFGALGGDFSSLSTNPAGIGIYRRSELTFTPSLYAGSTNSSFLNNSSRDSKFNFNFGNAGLIFANKINKEESKGGWKSWAFGFGYNRIDNYNNKSVYEGKNADNSLLDYFSETAGNSSYADLNSFYEYLAYQAYLINPDNDTATTQYTPALTEYGETQHRSVLSKGAKGETLFSFGGNYNNKLYLGATIGFESLHYEEESVYEETAATHVYDTLKSYKLTQDLTTDGTGVNLKLGFIYRPNDYFRFGFAFHTPTWYSMKDEYKNRIYSEFMGGTKFSKESADGSFDYELSTPFKAIGSLGFIFGNYGILGADFEIMDYSSANFSATDASFFETNQVISKKYTSTQTVRVGTEWKLENISLRGGVSYSTSPINDLYKASGSDYSKLGYSGGIGIRDEDFFIDFGYLYSESNQYYQPYTLALESVPGVKQKVATHNFTVTFGVKF
jgi:hypothetical protein